MIQVGAYLASVVAVFALTAHAAMILANAIQSASMAPRTGTNTVALTSTPPVVRYSVAPQSYLDPAKRETFWLSDRSSRRSHSESRNGWRYGDQASRLGLRPQDGQHRRRGDFGSWSFGFDDDDDDDDAPRPVSRYRTMCVRLCDGYYFPISFATTPDRFSADARQCSARCGAPARLFVYRNPGEEVEDMKDLSGSSYAKLRTAFLYRKAYDTACTCRAQPWDQASLDRHRMYALQARERKGNRTVRAELREMQRKVQTAKSDQQRKLQKIKQSTDRGWAPISAAALPPMPPRRGEVSVRIAGSISAPPPAATVSSTQPAPTFGGVPPAERTPRTTPVEPREQGDGSTKTASAAPATLSLDSSTFDMDRMSLGSRPKTALKGRSRNEKVVKTRAGVADDDWRRRVFRDN